MSFLSKVAPFATKHKPTILMAVGLTALASSVIMTVVATHKADKAIQKKKEELNVEKLPVKDVVKVSWKYYIPTAIGVVGGIACIIGGNRASATRQTAIAAAYAASETALTTYKSAAKEVLTPTQETKLNEAADKKLVAQTPISGTEDPTIVLTGNGDTIMFDELTGRFFKSSMNKVEKEMNRLNQLAIQTGSPITVNEWEAALGLSDVADGYERGWNFDFGNGHLIDIDDRHADVTENGVPYIIIKYKYRPVML